MNGFVTRQYAPQSCDSYHKGALTVTTGRTNGGGSPKRLWPNVTPVQFN
ncbi:hypothetical protein DEU38_102428 [Rhodococcus sp. AG1013]|nr:hypothetical protein DEU38_102428 [Rhodococcus sp. AG1013]